MVSLSLSLCLWSSSLDRSSLHRLFLWRKRPGRPLKDEEARGARLPKDIAALTSHHLLENKSGLLRKLESLGFLYLFFILVFHLMLKTSCG